MTWPAPTLDPPTAPPLTPPPSTARQPASDPSEIRRLLRAVTPAAWVALLGGALVLAAAGIVVASTWSSYGPAVRFVAIAAVTVGLGWAAERLRDMVPATAAIVAHVATLLVTASGVAGMSAFGFTWPACLAVGGGLAVAATELQARRWRRVTMHAAQPVAVAIAATGVAALTGTTGGLVAAIAAIGFVLAAAPRRAVATAAIAVVSPVLWALADAGVGAGTFERAGIVGERLGWSGPIVGVVAAWVLLVVGRARRDNVLVLAAGLAVPVGIVTGLATVDATVTAWWSVPALVVACAEASLSLLPTQRHRAVIGRVVDAMAALVAVGAIASPAVAHVVASFGTADALASLALPAALTGAVLGITLLRWWRADRASADIALAGMTAAGIVTVVALGAPSALAAALAIVGVALGAFVSRRISPLAVHVPAAWALVSIVDTADGGARFAEHLATGLLAVLVAIVVAVRARLAWRAGPLGWIETGAIVGAAGLTASALVDAHHAVAGMIAAALAAALVVLVERRFEVFGIVAIGAAGAIGTAFALDNSGSLDSTTWIGWAAATTALALVGSVRRSSLSGGAAAAALVITGVVAALGHGATVDELLTGLTIAAIGFTGLAATASRRTPADAAAVAAGALLVVSSAFALDRLWTSAAWFVVGCQVVAYGFTLRRADVRLAGAAVAAVAATSAWFTSGAHDWFLGVLEPIDVQPGDLWAALATATALAAGAAARRTLGANSWIAYSPGIAVAGIWLSGVQLDRDTVWAIPAALTFAMAAAAIGGWRRLAAPLVGGVALVGSTLLLASGQQLREVPTWAWLAVGGLALLGVAVLIERASRLGRDGIRELAGRWQ